ncbi:MAG: hypothetical protein AVO35_08960 [Candidatus Aegiribacteria sp. MLS_C]|nr:MAG: hypothetical protein AVO35_08960 [Candidatus Aegiribacteria sp. MLS_C]
MDEHRRSTVRIGFFRHEVGGSGPAKAAKIVVMVIIGLVGLAILALVFGVFVKLLWNALMPAIFGLPEISFWQGVGIVVLAHIIFGGDHGHRYEKRSSKRRLSEEKSLLSEMESDYRQFWREEGREAFGRWMKRENGLENTEE